MFIEIYDINQGRTLFINPAHIVSVEAGGDVCSVRMANGDDHTVKMIQLQINLDRLESPDYCKVVKYLERKMREVQE